MPGEAEIAPVEWIGGAIRAYFEMQIGDLT
jgi:hypothetical protein